MISGSSKSFWEDRWRQARLGKYRGIERYLAINRRIEGLYKRFLKKGKKRFIEIGCARGKELIYFAREFGYEPYGVDYSETGAALARKNLEIAGVRGTVLCEDIFETSLPPESFDIVYSAGLVEHFDNPDAIADAHVRLLKKGGTLIIIVPNFRDSLYSALMKIAGKKTLLAMHNTSVMSKEFLRGLTEGKGINILSLDYFGPIDLTSAFGTIKLTPLLWLAHLLNQVVGYATFWMPRSHYFSPCLVLIGQKTEGESRQG